MTDPVLESDLKALDEALRVSAKAAGWEEEDPSVEGIIPDYLQPHPGGPLMDFQLDRLPDSMRFVGWATYELTETAIIVTAETVILGSWPREVLLEYLHQSLVAAGLVRDKS
jgi:hypothetical protein